MPLVSLLDLENTLKLNQLINQVNTNNALNGMNNGFLLKQNANLANNILLNDLKNNLVNLALNANVHNPSTAAAQAAANNLIMNMNMNNVNKQINYSRYKTELCRQFSENGECKYGDKCQFAHGYNDLKDVNRHPKYKTDFCKTFHSKGFCPYGPRCHFIHDLNEKFELVANGSVSPQAVIPNAANAQGPVYDALVGKTSPIMDTTQHVKASPIEMDKKLEEIQSQLASSLFSSLIDDCADEKASKSTEKSKSDKTTTDKSLNKPANSGLLDEFNLSLGSMPSFGQSEPISPNTLSSSSSSAVSSSSSSSVSPSIFKSAQTQGQSEFSNVFSLANTVGVKDDVFSPQSSSPSSPTPRTRSSTSSTSSTFSNSSASSNNSTSASYNYYNRYESSAIGFTQYENVIEKLKSPTVKQQTYQQVQSGSYRNLNELAMLTSDLSLNKETAVGQSSSRLGPIGRPKTQFEQLSLLSPEKKLYLPQQQQQGMKKQQTPVFSTIKNFNDNADDLFFSNLAVSESKSDTNAKNSNATGIFLTNQQIIW